MVSLVKDIERRESLDRWWSATQDTPAPLVLASVHWLGCDILLDESVAVHLNPVISIHNSHWPWISLLLSATQDTPASPVSYAVLASLHSGLVTIFLSNLQYLYPTGALDIIHLQSTWNNIFFTIVCNSGHTGTTSNAVVWLSNFGGFLDAGVSFYTT